MKTDISSLSILRTCSCSTCTCSNNSQIKIQSNYLENNDDCLTSVFIIFYESSIWCMQIIYELFFKSLWQILIYIKQELQYRQSDHKTLSSMDMISINNSASRYYPLICKKKNSSEELSRYHFSLIERPNRRRRRSNCEDKIRISNKTYRSVSNQVSSQQKDSSSIDTHIVIVPVRSSYCQTETSRNDLQTINIDLNQSEKNINLHEQLTDTLSRRLHEPLIFMNREICCRQNQTSFFSTVPSSMKNIHSDLVSFHHSEQSVIQQQSPNEKKELFPYQQSSLLYSANQNNKLSITNGFSTSNTLHQSSSFLPPNSTDKTSFSNNSQPFIFDLPQRKVSQKQSKQKRRIINDNSIPLALATSLHSNTSLYNVDYFLTKYIHQLFTDKHHLR